MVLSPCVRAGLTKSQETEEINVWKNTEKVALKMTKSLMKHHFVKTDHICLRIKNMSTNYWQKFASVANGLGGKDKLTSERCPAILQRWQRWFHRGALSQGLRPCEGRPQLGQGRLGQSLWMWPWIPQRMQMGHFCWCVNILYEVFRMGLLFFSFVQSTWNHKTLGSGETYSSKRTRCTAVSQQQ